MFKRLISVVVGAAMLTACTTTNEVTGRSQLNLYPASQDAALGAQSLAEYKKMIKMRNTGPDAERVTRIGEKIAAVSNAPDLPWEFYVVDEDRLNAWALPGGKVAIYKKMLDTMDSDAQLAAIIGHEIAHASLRHGTERLSRAHMQQLAVLSIDVAVTASSKDASTGSLAATLAGLAVNGFVALPHSRYTELEADEYGALFMARAGYDPRASVSVWVKMEALKSGSSGMPEFLATHPDDGRRALRLAERMPRFLEEYEKSKARN